ncbi:MAG: hypothetical protein ACKO0Z_06955 [Betaproteobacteria bacterium]
MLRDGTTTKHYRDALSGEGSLGYDWSDKPHRLVFDLCGEIEAMTKFLKKRGLFEAYKKETASCS